MEIEARWAGAWVRVLRGDPPWPRPSAPRAEGDRRDHVATAPAGSKPWALGVLGLGPAATVIEIKRAFRAIALRAHPDRGGDDAVFIAAKRAHDVALAAAQSPRKRRRAR